MAFHQQLHTSILTEGGNLITAANAAWSRIGVNILDVTGTSQRPATCLVHQASVVIVLHQIDICLSVMLTASLIEVDPCHNTGHILQIVKHGKKLLGKPLGIVFHIAVAASVVHARHILPYHQAHLVAPIVPTGRLHLDVLPHHIEAYLLHKEDIVLYGLIARWSEVALRPITLVQASHIEEEFIVDCHPPAVTHLFLAHLTHSEIS